MRYPKCSICKNYVPHALVASCLYCYSCSAFEEKPITNGDRIRAMSDEELAEWLSSFGAICEICSDNTFACDDETIACGRCVVGITNWLKQPVGEE